MKQLLVAILRVALYVLKDNTELGELQKTFQLHFLRTLRHQILGLGLRMQKIGNLQVDQYLVVALNLKLLVF